MLMVKVAQLGRPVVEVALEEGSTVASALLAADVELAQGQRAHVNGSPADAGRTLRTGDVVMVANVPSVKGAAGR